MTITPIQLDPGYADRLAQWEAGHGIVLPTAEERAAAAALATQDEQAATSARAEPVIRYLVTHTPAECEAWVQANVTDLASAKNLLGKLAMALCVLARARLR